MNGVINHCHVKGSIFIPHASRDLIQFLNETIEKNMGRLKKRYVSEQCAMSRNVAITLCLWHRECVATLCYRDSNLVF